MLALKISITRFLDASQPGFVEGTLVDAHGREWKLVDKVPVITDADLDEESTYPQPGSIACAFVRSRLDETGREIVTVDTRLPWGVDATTEDTVFEVYRDQLIEVGMPPDR
jgi:hypothetical protein